MRKIEAESSKVFTMNRNFMGCRNLVTDTLALLVLHRVFMICKSLWRRDICQSVRSCEWHVTMVSSAYVNKVKNGEKEVIDIYIYIICILYIYIRKRVRAKMNL